MNNPAQVSECLNLQRWLAGMQTSETFEKPFDAENDASAVTKLDSMFTLV